MTDHEFSEMRERGFAGESRLANFLRRRGNSVLPTYGVPVTNSRGPILLGPDSGADITLADLLLFGPGGGAFWVESKTKTEFTWHRNTERFTTGLDLRSYAQYQELQAATRIRVLVFFIHPNADRDFDRAGLYYRSLDALQQCENHRHAGAGLVYWAHASLKKLCNSDEFAELSEPIYRPPVNRISSPRSQS